MNNIAEGFERYVDIEFKRFLDISKASCEEVRSMLYLANDLKYIDSSTVDTLQESCRLLSAGIQKPIISINKKIAIAKQALRFLYFL